MNIPNMTNIAITSYLLSVMYQKLTSPDICLCDLNLLARPASLIKIRDKCSGVESNQEANQHNGQCTTTGSQDESGECCGKNYKSQDSANLYEQVNFETYKQLKEVVKEQDPGISKQEIYDKLLQPFKHSKQLRFDSEAGRERVFYYCGYDGCGKEFTKTWNLLDHVRMHEGIKPYQCEQCGRSFTQKGNLKKHMKQHSMKSLKERKRFRCSVCKKKYTERYNLKAHMKQHI